MSIRKGTKLISGLPENIQSIYNQNNADIGLRFWSGTQDEYKAITVKDSNTIYNVISKSTEPEPQKLSTINPFDFGDNKYTSIPIANASWLKSEGQWNSGNTYLKFYEWVVENAINHEEGFKLSSETYTDYDFVVNTSDNTFRLPLLNGSEDVVSDKYDDLTLGATGTEYIAPANGYIYIEKVSGTSGAYMNIEMKDKNDNYLFSSGMNAPGSSNYSRIYLPIQKGYKFYFYYSMTGETRYCRFIYAQGNGDLYYYVGDTIQDSKLINMSNVLNEIASIKSNIVIEEYVNGTSGYRIWASGYCEQWGISNNGTTMFVKEFANTDYNMTCMAGGHYGTGADIGIYLTSKNTNGFNMERDRSTDVNWRASGYLKEGEY